MKIEINEKKLKKIINESIEKVLSENDLYNLRSFLGRYCNNIEPREIGGMIQTEEEYNIICNGGGIYQWVIWLDEDCFWSKCSFKNSESAKANCSKFLNIIKKNGFDSLVYAYTEYIYRDKDFDGRITGDTIEEYEGSKGWHNNI